VWQLLSVPEAVRRALLISDIRPSVDHPRTGDTDWSDATQVGTALSVFVLCVICTCTAMSVDQR
jgi:hypothetical protein